MLLWLLPRLILEAALRASLRSPRILTTSQRDFAAKMSENVTARSSRELDLVDLYDRRGATPASHTGTTNTLNNDATTVALTSRTETTHTLDVEQNRPSNTRAQAPTTVMLTDQTNLLPFRKVMAVFAGLSLCMFVSTLDSVIVATALPTIGAFFSAGAVASWVPSAYLLTSTAFQPLCENLDCSPA